MIKIMLVDDEPFFISDMRDTIKRIGGDYKVIYEAYDAQDALNNIKTYKPDIIFVDIKMPGMNGICLVREIKKNYSNIIPIILSGYQDFELAREALRASADDYLLKPIDENQLKNVLNIKVNKLMTIRRHIEFQLLDQLIRNIQSVSDFIGDYFDYHSFCLIVITCSVGEINERELSQIAGDSFNDFENYWIIDQESDPGQFILFGLNHSNISTVYNIAVKLFKKDCIRRNMASIALSPIFKDIRDIGNVYKMMSNRIDSLLVLGQPSVYLFDDNITINKELYDRLQKEFETKLYNALWTNNWAAFCNIMTETLRYCESNLLPKVFIKKFLTRITIAVEKTYQIHQEYENLPIERYIERIVDNAKDSNELTCEYFSYLLKVFIIDDVHDLMSDEKMMVLLESYLRESITKKVKVKTVCKNFFISQSRMNRIIKQYKKMSFIEYFTYLKIEKAKNVLQEQPDISLSSLALMLGFNDYFYFIKVFKKITSYTPTQYRGIITKI